MGLIKPAGRVAGRVPHILGEREMPGTSLAHRRCSEPLPCSLPPHPCLSWSLSPGLPPHLDLCYRGGSSGPGVWIPGSPFSLYCTLLCDLGQVSAQIWSAQIIPKARSLLCAQAVSSWGHWTRFPLSGCFPMELLLERPGLGGGEEERFLFPWKRCSLSLQHW